ncbi:MAG: GNAT family N-acetyltransferase [Devosia sp.]|nr:GNAT family N-acetyltransferase [Devosia sp.]
MDAIAAMVEGRRVQYEAYEPLFWKKAATSEQMGRAFLSHLLNQADTLCLVAELDGRVAGFLIATPARVPPVFEPGQTAMIDDFCVARPELWSSLGPALLDSARTRLQAAGYAQIVVVCGFKDAEKTAFLETQDLSLTSTWWSARA